MTGLSTKLERRGGVQRLVRVLRLDPEVRENDQDEDEVNLQVRISN